MKNVKKYTTPDMDIVEFKAEDVIVASAGSDTYADDGGNDI